MTLEQEKGAPSDATEWHPSLDERNAGNGYKTENSEGMEENPSQLETGLERFRPTPENPIQDMRIGLQHSMGQVDKVTRVVVTLENGTTASIPWEQAEKYLPPDFKEARELGERARRLGSEISMLSTAIRSGTDVMERSGHAKDALMRLVRRNTKPVQYLNASEDLFEAVDNIAQESFLELRRMTNRRQSRAEEIQGLENQLDKLQEEYDQLREKIFQDLGKVQPFFRDFISSKHSRLESNGNHTRSQLDNPEETKK